MSVSLRLPDDLTQRLNHLAAKTGRTKTFYMLETIKQHIDDLEDPRSVGEALKGSELGDFWKYRVGYYRIIANIEDGALRILVLKVGNRREIYR